MARKKQRLRVVVKTSVTRSDVARAHYQATQHLRDAMARRYPGTLPLAHALGGGRIKIVSGKKFSSAYLRTRNAYGHGWRPK